MKALREGGLTVTVNSVRQKALLLRSKSGKTIKRQFKSKNITNIRLHIDKRVCEEIRFTAAAGLTCSFLSTGSQQYK